MLWFLECGVSSLYAILDSRLDGSESSSTEGSLIFFEGVLEEQTEYWPSCEIILDV
jgi:hypothetical protein